MSKNLTHGDIEMWLNAFDIIYKATGRVPQYMLDDWKAKLDLAAPNQRLNFFAQMRASHSYLLPFFSVK